jgi:lipopolysaccharide/colanic/teichoic acid biosynthesis glycosyltransferase
MLKRAFDMLAAAFALAIIWPFLLVLMMCVRYTAGSPIFFRQTRVGYKGRQFQIIKFRTMSDQRDESGELLPDASRLTAFGRFLRSTSLDELPELYNILRGDMSFVGPRPLLVEYLPLYSSRQAVRHEVRPGLTGWAQINGRNALNWQDRLEMDVWYVENHSFTLDLQILLMTISKVIKREGINSADAATMTPFRGNNPKS